MRILCLNRLDKGVERVLGYVLSLFTPITIKTPICLYCALAVAMLWGNTLNAAGKPHTLPENTQDKGYSATVNRTFDDIYREMTNLKTGFSSLSSNVTYSSQTAESTSIRAQDVQIDQYGDLTTNDVQAQTRELQDEKLSKVKADSTAYSLTVEGYDVQNTFQKVETDTTTIYNALVSTHNYLYAVIQGTATTVFNRISNIDNHLTVLDSSGTVVFNAFVSTLSYVTAVDTSSLRLDGSRAMTGDLETVGINNTGVFTTTGTSNFSNNIYIHRSTAVFNNTGLGIGTLSPSWGIDLYSSQAITIAAMSNAALAANIGGNIYFGGRYTASAFTQWAAIKGLKENAASGDLDGKLQFLTRTTSGGWGTNMTIDSNGDVGIGTTNPPEKLSVVGNQSSTGAIILNGNLVFPEPNTYSIGQYQQNRPYNVYVASQVVIGNSIYLTGEDIYSSTLGAYLFQVSSTSVIMPSIEVDEITVKSKGLKLQGKGVSSMDIEISTSTRGIVLTAPNKSKYLVWLDNNGTLFTTQISASPEISFEERLKLMAAKEAEVSALKTQYKTIIDTDLKAKIEIMERLQGLK